MDFFLVDFFLVAFFLVPALRRAQGAARGWMSKELIVPDLK